MSLEIRLQAEEQKSNNSKSIPQLTPLNTLTGNETIPAWSTALNSIVQIPVSLLNTGSGEDGNEEVIIRGDDIENIAPSTGDIPNPVNGDTASVYLTSGKMEKWVYTTTWAKAFTITSGQAPKTAGLGLNETATEYKLGDDNVNEDVELILVPTGSPFTPRKISIKLADNSTYFDFKENGADLVGQSHSINSTSSTSIRANESVLLGSSSEINIEIDATLSSIFIMHQNIQLTSPNSLVIQPSNNDTTPGSQLNFVLAKTSDQGATNWVDPNTLISGSTSQAFEQNVTADGTVFTITSATPITDADVYVDQVRMYPSDYTINSTTNEITFTNTVFVGSIIHGRIYN